MTTVETIVAPLNDEQRRSQISGGHRLIAQVRSHRFQLYSDRDFATRAVAVDAEYWLGSVMTAVSGAVSKASAARVDAALARARKQAGEYGVSRPGAAEVVAEALFDGKWFKTKKEHVTRRALRDQIQRMIDRGEPVELVFPIFSRKPMSPVKNRGTAPDAAEIHSLARCAALAHTLNALSPTGAVLKILADGRKYNRACRTPHEVVVGYQDSLRAWVDELGATGVLQIVDYEDWVRDGVPAELWYARAKRYQERARALRRDYSVFFDPADPSISLAEVAALDDVGAQLAFTFWSIATSANYQAFQGHPDLMRDAYVSYVLSLRHRLSDMVPRRASLAIDDDHTPLRREAFAAACRYVAISLADRDLNILRTVTPDAIKLTIHGKPGELHLVTASSRDANMTAQHCTGGYDLRGDEAKPTFKYLIEREAQCEIPVLVAGATHRTDPRFRALAQLERARQPIGYVNDAGPVLQETLHRMLERTDV